MTGDLYSNIGRYIDEVIKRLDVIMKDDESYQYDEIKVNYNDMLFYQFNDNVFLYWELQDRYYRVNSIEIRPKFHLGEDIIKDVDLPLFLCYLWQDPKKYEDEALKEWDYKIENKTLMSLRCRHNSYGIDTPRGRIKAFSCLTIPKEIWNDLGVKDAVLINKLATPMDEDP